jgi:hypothetical protein
MEFYNYLLFIPLWLNPFAIMKKSAKKCTLYHMYGLILVLPAQVAPMKWGRRNKGEGGKREKGRRRDMGNKKSEKRDKIGKGGGRGRGEGRRRKKEGYRLEKEGKERREKEGKGRW